MPAVPKEKHTKTSKTLITTHDVASFEAAHDEEDNKVGKVSLALQGLSLGKKVVAHSILAAATGGSSIDESLPLVQTIYEN